MDAKHAISLLYIAVPLHHRRCDGVFCTSGLMMMRLLEILHTSVKMGKGGEADRRDCMHGEMQSSAMQVHSSVLLCLRHAFKPISPCARKLFSRPKKHCGIAQGTEC